MPDNAQIDKCSSQGATIFLSYSRSDRRHAERIAQELRDRKHEVSRDLDDILPTEEWRHRIKELITDADVIVFLLSPKSAASEVCRWEVEVAQNLNKKIAPIVVEDIEGAQIPPMLSRLNYIFATEGDRFENAVNSLCDAISTDIEWLREHTRLTRLATQFAKSRRRKCDLLSDTALNEAELWLARRPATVSSISPRVLDYVEASRGYRAECGRYSEARLKALTELVDPLLDKEVEYLRARARELDDRWKNTFVKADSEGSELRDRIKAIENFRSNGGRWHPLPANFLENLGPQGDYLEVYQFPCCGIRARLADEGVPLQFRADGCEQEPSALTEGSWEYGAVMAQGATGAQSLKATHGEDLDWLLKEAIARASPLKLRQLAVNCCRLLLERFSDEWPRRVFLADEGHPGGHVSPNDWPGELILEVVRTADAGTRTEGVEDLHERAKIIAENCRDAWQWANAKLGDNATGAEYEVGFVAWQVASAARDCCREDIHSSVVDCIEHTIAALGFRWNEAEKVAAIHEERKAMAEIVRNIILHSRRTKRKGMSR